MEQEAAAERCDIMSNGGHFQKVHRRSDLVQETRDSKTLSKTPWERESIHIFVRYVRIFLNADCPSRLKGKWNAREVYRVWGITVGQGRWGIELRYLLKDENEESHFVHYKHTKIMDDEE